MDHQASQRAPFAVVGRRASGLFSLGLGFEIEQVSELTEMIVADWVHGSTSKGGQESRIAE